MGNYNMETQSDEHAAPKCGPLQKIKVQRQWRASYGEGSQRVEFALHLWKNFFKAYPAARSYLKKYRSDNIYSPEFQAFGQRITSNLGLIIESYDDPEAAKVFIARVKGFHTAAGVAPEAFDAFPEPLLDTLHEHLGHRLDWDAWMPCLTALVNLLKA